MPKQIDPTPIPIQRSRNSQRYELLLDASGALVLLIAHRFLVTTQGGVEIGTLHYLGSVTIPAASVPVAIKNKIADIEALVDAADTGTESAASASTPAKSGG